MISYFPVVTGSLSVSGSVNISGGITASGGITISGSIDSASYAATASFVALAQSASNAIVAQTSSYANNLTVAGTLTAQTLVVQTITSSVDFVTGSTRFGSTIGNTHQFTGSVSITGSLSVNNTTPSFTLTDVAATGNNGNVSIRAEKPGIGYNTLNYIGFQHIFKGGGTESTFLTINSAGAATFASSVKMGNASSAAILTTATGADIIVGSGTDSSPAFQVWDDNSLSIPRFIVTRGGLVRINTTSTLGGGIFGLNGNIEFGGTAGGNYRITNYQAGFLAFGTDNTERMRITSAGFVGINGDPLSNARLSVTDAGAIIVSGNAVAGSTAKGIYVENSNNGDESIGVWFRTGGNHLSGISGQRSNTAGGWGTDLRFYTHEDNTVDLTTTRERMRVSSNGTVFVGTSSVGGSLHIVGTGTAFIVGQSGSGAKQLLVGIDSGTGTSELQSVWQGTAYTRLNLNPNGGQVYAGGSRLDNISDERVKDNIQPITGALDKVLSITGKKFHLKDEEEGKLRYGFIAQELEGILDEFVVQTNMTFKKDDLEVENVKSLDNWASSWSALLVEAIKELNTKFEDYKATHP
jgi:hypothetical protein